MPVLDQWVFVFAAKSINLLDYLLFIGSSPLLVIFFRISRSPLCLIIFLLPTSHRHCLPSIQWQEHVSIRIDKLPATTLPVLRNISLICHALIHYAIISDGTFLYESLPLLFLLYQEILLGLVTSVVDQCLIDVHGS